MNSLRESQLKFKNSLLYGTTEVVSAIAKKPLMTAENAFAIYQHNYRQTLLKTMRMTFPVTLGLVGDQYFDQLASEYIRVSPSKTFDLNAYGVGFSNFVSNDLPYLHDVVLLEWYTQCCYLSPVPVAFDFEAFGRVPDSQKGKLVFTVNDSVFLLQSEFPLLDIWKLHAGECDRVNLDKGGQCVLVCQERGKPVLMSIEPGMLACLDSVKKGACFEALIDDVDLLMHAIKQNWINGFII